MEVDRRSDLLDTSSMGSLNDLLMDLLGLLDLPSGNNAGLFGLVRYTFGFLFNRFLGTGLALGTFGLAETAAFPAGTLKRRLW